MRSLRSLFRPSFACPPSPYNHLGHRNELKKERLRLKAEVKRANVEQQRRIDEYRRLQTLRKLQGDAERTDKLLNDKATMIEQRKAAAIATKNQRDKIQKAMEKIRREKKWDKAKSAFDVDLLGGGTTPQPGGQNKRSMPKRGSNPLSQSAPQFDRQQRDEDPMRHLPPRPAGGKTPQVLAQQRAPQPKQYISPYEMESSPATNYGAPPREVPAFAHRSNNGEVTL